MENEKGPLTLRCRTVNGKYIIEIILAFVFSAAMSADPNVISKYRAGFNECAAEISRYLDTVNGGSPELKARVMNYLANSMAQFPVIPVYQGMVPSAYVQLQQHSGYLNPLPHQNICMSPDFIQAQTVDNERHVQFSSSYTTMTSPDRLAPSPSGSDSGLSDSSAIQDENGNYSHLNKNRSPINIRIKYEQENFFDVPNEQRQKTLYSQSERTSMSPKRRRHNPSDNVTPPKRQRSCDNPFQETDCKPINLASPQHFSLPGNVSMWRPW